jgi:hypothetical protein
LAIKRRAAQQRASEGGNRAVRMETRCRQEVARIRQRLSRTKNHAHLAPALPRDGRGLVTMFATTTTSLWPTHHHFALASIGTTPLHRGDTQGRRTHIRRKGTNDQTGSASARNRSWALHLASVALPKMLFFQKKKRPLKTARSFWPFKCGWGWKGLVRQGGQRPGSVVLCSAPTPVLRALVDGNAETDEGPGGAQDLCRFEQRTNTSATACRSP